MCWDYKAVQQKLYKPFMMHECIAGADLDFCMEGQNEVDVCSVQSTH